MKRVSALIKFNPNGYWLKKLTHENRLRLLSLEQPCEVVLEVADNYLALNSRYLNTGYHLFSNNSRETSEPDFFILMVKPYD